MPARHIVRGARPAPDDCPTDLRFHSQLTRGRKKNDSPSHNFRAGYRQVTLNMSSAVTKEYLNSNETGFSIRLSTDMRVNLHMTFISMIFY